MRLSLLELWCSEDLPRPVTGEPWTPQRARRWLADYEDRFGDMTTMILSASSERELYDLTAVAARHGVRMIYLHTDTWRGEYWPNERSWLHVNEAVFPAGRADLKRYTDHLETRGMKLALHTTSAGIGPSDPERIAKGVDRNLATWCRGSLAAAVDATADTLSFRPAAGQDVPLALPSANGPGLRPPFFRTDFIRIDDEIIRVGQFTDTDRPVWTLRHCQRGYGATAPAAHADAAETVGLLSAYGQNFVPDNDSPLLEEMAREFAEFANQIGLDQLEYDAYEIQSSTPWGPQKFSDAVARHLDHPVITNTSSGRPVSSNIELLFSRIRDINQFGYHTVNLSLQLDSHRPATSLLDAWFELSSLAAKGVRRFQILKPEPMFGVSEEILATHGLAEEMLDAFSLWRDVTPLLSADHWKALRATLERFGSHTQGKDLFQVRRTKEGYDLIPTRVMVRRAGDVPWRVGQEFGPIGPRQFCRPGESFEVENPFAPQPARFVIRVLSELGAIDGPAAAATASAADVVAESYRAAAAEAAWADGDWGWRFGAKNFDYGQIRHVSLAFGMIPPRSTPRVRIRGLRLLRDVPSKLVRPVIRIGSGSLTVAGEIETGCYLRYDGGETAIVFDRNWNRLRTLPVAADASLMPAGFATVRIDVPEDAPRPWLEVQTIVTGEPIQIPKP